MSNQSSGIVIISGNSNPPLVSLVCERLGICLSDVEVFNKTNRETSIKIKQVRKEYKS